MSDWEQLELPLEEFEELEFSPEYMGIRGGGIVWLDNVRPDDFEPEVIARTLANENRYAGNYGTYSVAQHAVLVARVAKLLGGDPSQVLAALHHDDSEVITGDLPAPVKRWLRNHTDAWDDLEGRINHAVGLRYSVDMEDPVIKKADDIVFYWEVFRLVPQGDRGKYEPLPDPEEFVLPYAWFIPWSAEEAFARYMDVHETCWTAIESVEVPDEFAKQAS